MYLKQLKQLKIINFVKINHKIKTNQDSGYRFQRVQQMALVEKSTCRKRKCRQNDRRKKGEKIEIKESKIK